MFLFLQVICQALMWTSLTSLMLWLSVVAPLQQKYCTITHLSIETYILGV